MPTPYKGRRQALTIRLPIDTYVEAARRAKRRQWSLSHFVAFCVEREFEKEGREGDKRHRNPILVHHPPGAVQGLDEDPEIAQ